MGPRLATLALSIAALGAWSGAARAADKATCLRAYESAQNDKNAGKLRASRKKLLVCVEPECPALLRADCTSWLTEVERGMPTVVVVARSGQEELSNVRVLVDDEVLAESLTGAALEVDPGQRVFRFEAPGHAAAEQTVTIREGEKSRTLSIALRPLDGSREGGAGPPATSWVLAGVGALGLVSFSYFGIRGLGGRSDLKACKGECAQDDVDAVRADFTRADVSLAIGALAFGGALYFYLSSRGERAPERSAASLTIAPRPGGAQTRFQLAF